MLTQKIQDEIQSAVLAIFKKHLKADDIKLEKPAEKQNGDLSTNISFRLGAELKKSPAEIAESLSEAMGSLSYFKEVRAAGGFVNFYLAPEVFQKNLAEILAAGEKYGQNDLFAGKKVQVEFISANPTGPLTLANGRGGFSGDVLGRVFSWSSAEVQREYYVNDGGNQVKVLGQSILASAGLTEPSEDNYKGQYIEDWAKANVKMVAEHKDQPFELGQIAAKEILDKYNKPTIKKIGIDFDNFFSEEKMIKSGAVEAAIVKFGKMGHTYEKDGALWMKTTEFGDDKDRVLVKSDGEKTYFANDVAYHYDKFYTRSFDLVVNFWGADHHGYVPRMLAAAAAMGRPDQLKIVIFQLVKLVKGGQEFKMSKRTGNFVTMDDLLELIGGEDARDVARFFFLSRSFDTHMDFDLDLAKDRSEKNPVFYVKYAYARIHGILENASSLSSLSEAKDLDSSVKPQNDKSKTNPDLSLLAEPAEFELIDKLSELPGLVASITTLGGYPVHSLTFYAQDLAKKFHYFYDQCRVIDVKNPELTAARLELVKATKIVLGIVMKELIGIDAPEKMTREAE